MTLTISAAFDSCNFIVNAASDPQNVRLEIAKDNRSFRRYTIAIKISAIA